MPLRDRAAIERQVLEVVSGLVVELGGGAAATLDAAFDRDLGISSLERVELLLRLERSLGVRLPDTTMAEAGSPGDLVDALLGAPAAAGGPDARLRPAVDEGQHAPHTTATLIEALRWHVQAHPDRPHVFLVEDDDRERTLTYRDLWSRAGRVAAGLRDRGLAPGDTVALMLRTEAAFFEAFVGTLLAGCTPVPIYPPVRADRIEEYTLRQTEIVRNAGARALVTFAQVERVAKILRGRAAALREVVTVDQLAQSVGPIPATSPKAEELALIQYTSGSTGEPKGVALTHRNVLANIRAIGAAMAIGPGDVGISWLPLYHDMGLIGSWLGALYFGVPITIMSPIAFLSRPARWLWAIHRHRGTVSPAPNFAFDLCVHRITDDEIAGLDLSSWRLALNGSELVSPGTIERFTRRFGAYGFRAEAMCPVYGLAECAVGLTASPLNRRPRVDVIARQPFQQARAILPAGDGDAALELVSCGTPLPGHEIRIADDRGQPLDERIEGRLEFRGPSRTAGYYRNPPATRAILRDDWMDSGDLGYVADGELFITGRRKDVIIRAGRNLQPQEVEEVAGRVDGVRQGCVAAFGMPDERTGTERLVVVAETRQVGAARREALRAAVVDRVTRAVGVPPDRVVIAPPGSVLKTSSGKIRRAATRDALATGEIGRRPPPAIQWARLRLRDLGHRLRDAVRHPGDWLLTGYVLLLMGLTVPFLWCAVLMLPAGRWPHRAVSLWASLGLTLVGLRPRVEGVERLAGVSPAILVANHASYIDSVVLMASLPLEYRFVAKRGLTAYRLLGAIIRKARYLTVEKAGHGRRLAGADELTAALGVGDSLVIFPEGTFVAAPGLLPFRLGAFRAAVETGRPVVPVAIGGTRAVLPADRRLVRLGPIAVTILEPIWPAGAGWPEMVRLRDTARAAVVAACGEPDAVS